ncbi:hypothetical protein NC651_034718 [Populus alba x Populus x berolinensis]|nr:hypothetical protein NC651_034718 [Populus alba x Populus x berolinensis]
MAILMTNGTPPTTPTRKVVRQVVKEQHYQDKNRGCEPSYFCVLAHLVELSCPMDVTNIKSRTAGTITSMMIARIMRTPSYQPVIGPSSLIPKPRDRAADTMRRKMHCRPHHWKGYQDKLEVLVRFLQIRALEEKVRAASITRTTGRKIFLGAGIAGPLDSWCSEGKKKMLVSKIKKKKGPHMDRFSMILNL